MLRRGHLSHWAAPWLGLLIAGGCGARTVDVGEAMVRLDLASCYGTRCDGSEVEPSVIGRPPESACTTGAPYTVAWRTVVQYAALALAPDDTLWALTRPGGSSIALQRFDTAGELVAPVATDLAGGAFHVDVTGTSLAVSAEGRAFVGLTLNVTEKIGWTARPRHLLLEFDERCEPVGEPIEIAGVREQVTVAIGADGALLVSAVGEAGGAVLGRLDRDQRVRWIQTGTRQSAIRQLVGDDRGRTLAFGQAAAATPFQQDDSLASYDASGALVWEVRPGTALGTFVHHVDGRTVVFGGEPIPNAEATLYGEFYAVSLDEAGDEQWSLRIPGQGYGTTNVGAWSADDQGNTFVMDVPTVYRLDPDGGCEGRSLEAGQVSQGEKRALFVTTRGATYFAVNFGVGVLEP